MKLPKLTKNEKEILALMAYLFDNCYLNNREILSIASKLMPSATARVTLKSLAKKKLITYNEGYRYERNDIRPGLLFTVLRMLLSDENAELYKKIRKAVDNSKPVTTKLSVLYAISLFEHNDLLKISYLSSSDTRKIAYELSSVITDPEYHDVMALVPDKLLWLALETRLNEAIENDDDIDWEYLRRIIFEDRKVKPVRSVATIELHSGFNFYYYLATGKMCIDIEKAPVGIYSLLTVAIQTLYRGGLEAAYKIFNKAMTLSNKQTNEKGVFDSFVVNYYYTICLLLLDNETTRKKIDTLAKKKRIQSQKGHMVVMPLIIYLRQHKEIDVKHYPAASPETGLRWLSWMIFKKFGISEGDRFEDLSLTSHPIKSAYLRAELQPTGMVPASDEAVTLLGSSVFYRLKVKTIWEMRLEEIINENAQVQTQADDDRDTRLIYLMEYSSIVPILQKRLKNGSWSVGKRLTMNAFTNLTNSDVELDECDERLMKHVDVWDYSIYMDAYLHHFVGCDHLYKGSVDDLVPVSVHDDKPFLIINRDKDGSFSVSTNVEEICNEYTTKKSIWKKNTDTDYSIYSPSSTEKKVYRQILAQKKYPKEAEELLMKVISTLGGKTEIHSNMVVDLDDLETVDGNSRITLRCSPDSYDSYNISISVHAFPGLVYVPGTGNTNIIADQDGKKVQVTRHLRTERSNMKQVALKLADLGVIDDAGDLRPQAITDTLRLPLEAFLEMMQWVKDNQDICEMEWPEGARVKYHPAVKSNSAHISFKAKNGWFDVEGDVQISENDVISLQKLLELMHAQGKGRYIKVGENEYITLSSDLSKILKRLDTVTTEHRNHLQMSSAAVGLIGEVLDNTEADIKQNKAMDELRQRIAESASLQPMVPKALCATLRDYQEEGFEWMEKITSWGAGACLADDMGLGKTLQTIAMLLDKKADGASLVVAPASVVPNWRNELKRFAPSLRVTMLNDAEDRAEAIKTAGEGDIVVSTYALLNIQQEQLAEKEWNIICLDEAHTIKNPGTKMSKAAMTLQAKRKVILTGTPIQNHLAELWNLFQFINPGLLGSAEQFSKKFIEPIEGHQDKERQSQLRRLISPFLLRRTKGEVIEELPEKNEIVVPVELSPEETTMYEVHRRQAEQAVMADKSVKISTLAEITRLRQMACSVSLVDKKWKKPSSKVLAFIDLAESLNDSGNRALVFSQFTSFFDQVRAAMDKAKLPYLYLDGSTPLAQREKLVKEFQSGTCPFFLISLKAGGLGLNLTGANYVIHLDPWWNPAIEQQATDRAYRIGQKQDVTVYHLLSQHTIEEKIRRLHKTKRDLADSLLEGTDMSHALTQEELLELLQ